MSLKFYAYIIEHSQEQNIVNDWEECKKKVSGTKARYKSFKTQEEAKAWLAAGAKYEKNQEKKIKKEMKQNQILEEGLYFDAGTGRGRGVEVRLTDKSGQSLLKGTKYTKKLKLNEYENFELGFDKTNNYGELLGLYLALDIALERGIKKIFGDSHLVIFFWSIGKYHPEKLEEATVKLILATIQKRKKFEEKGGSISYVSGDINPADLGFHK